jgi:hypothetical protein
MYRLRLAAVYGAFALVLVGSGVGAFLAVSATAAHRGSAAAVRCTAPKATTDPMVTALFFIRSAVERANPAEGYALATPALRGATTCRDWARGRVPVKEYRNVDWQRSQYRVETQGTGQIVMQVLLISKSVSKPSLFMLELRQIGPAWRVGYWGPSDVAA